MKTKEEIEKLADEYVMQPKYDDKGHKGSFIKGYTQCQKDMQKDVEYWQGEFDHWHQQAIQMADTSKVTRFEVIDTNGRVYQKWNCNVELSYQDDGRTLKVFIIPLNKQD